MGNRGRYLVKVLLNSDKSITDIIALFGIELVLNAIVVVAADIQIVKRGV